MCSSKYFVSFLKSCRRYYTSRYKNFVWKGLSEIDSGSDFYCGKDKCIYLNDQIVSSIMQFVCPLLQSLKDVQQSGISGSMDLKITGQHTQIPYVKN